MIRSFYQASLIVTLTLLLIESSFAGVELKEFKTPDQETIYKELIFELRCLVCQNQNLADSNAELAIDLRRQTYEMIIDGSDKQGVIDYMVARYGDFVLYRPPLTPATFLLWFGPFFFLLISLFFLLKYISAKKNAPTVELSNEEKNQVRSLLDD